LATRCPASRRRLGTGAWETAGRQLTDVETAARRQRATGDAASCGPSDTARTAAVGTAAIGARRSGNGRARRGARSGRELSKRGARGEAALSGGRGSCRDARRAVPIAALSRGVGTALGGYAAAAHCRAGPVRCAATDRSGPLISDF
jgi:hypothetical protein